MIPEFPNEVNPNPVTAIDLRTEQGVTLRWHFDPPVQQSRMMLALGGLFAQVSEEMPELSLPVEGPTLNDVDLWGLQEALQHGLRDGCFVDNAEWAKGMVDRLTNLRAMRETSNASS